MIKKLLIATFTTLVLGTLTATAYADKLTPNETFKNPDKQFDVSGMKHFSKSDTILVPSLYLHTLVEGEHKVSKGGAHAKAKYALTNASPELGTEMATIIYNDLVNKLKASGWKVLTYQDVKDNEGWAKLKEAEPHKKLGIPGYDMNVGYGTNYYMTSFPADTKKLELASAGLPNTFKIFNSVTKKMGVNMLFPSYTFTGPVAYGAADKGYSATYASAGVIPAMDIIAIFPGFTSAKGAWAFMNPKQHVRVSENIGTIAVASQSSTENKNLFTFETFRSIAKGDYLLTIDETEYKRAIIQSATDYNTLLVEALKEALPKEKK